MRASWLAACALALAIGPAASRANAAPVSSPAGALRSGPRAVRPAQGDRAETDMRATWGPQRSEAEIGEPVPWTLEVKHPRRARPSLLSRDLGEQLDRTWVLVSGPEIRTRDDDGLRSAVTTFTWTLMALEPGERSAPVPGLAGASGAAIEVAARPLAVGAALAPDEDAPRPLAAFHEQSLERGPSGLVFGLLSGLLLAALLTPFVVRRVRRRRAAGPGAAPPLDPRRALEGLAAERAQDPESVRALAFEVTGILRHALAPVEPGATDEEWLAAARERSLSGAGRVDGALVERAEQVVRACEEIKYGGRIPTRFAVDELLANARAVLDGLEAPSAQSERSEVPA